MKTLNLALRNENLNPANSLFWALAEPLGYWPEGGSYPTYGNVFQKDGEKYKAEFNVAGVKKSDIKLETEGQRVIVNYKYKNADYSFDTELPDDAATDNLKAEYENGILAITAEKVNKRKEIVLG